MNRDQTDGVSSNVPLGMLLGLVGVIIFGGTVPATRLAVLELEPWFVTFGRAAIAGFIGVGLLFVFKKNLPRKLWVRCFLGGLCLVIGFPGFLAIALQTVPAAHSGVVLGLLPITTAVLAVIFAGERPSVAFWVWSSLGAILILVFTFRDGVPGFVLGDLWLLCATLSASLGYVISGALSREKPGWEVICWQLVLTSPLVLVGVYLFWDNAVFTAALPAQLGFVYVSLFSMLLGFFTWNAGLALGGIARVGQIQLLQTFVTIFIAALVLGEVVSFETYGFALLIVLTIFFTQRARIIVN